MWVWVKNRCERIGSSVRDHLAAELAQPGAGIEDQPLRAAAHLDAGRVAAIAQAWRRRGMGWCRARPRNGWRTRRRVGFTSFGAVPGTRAFDRCAVRLFHVAAKHITPNDGIGNSAPREVLPAAASGSQQRMLERLVRQDDAARLHQRRQYGSEPRCELGVARGVPGAEIVVDQRSALRAGGAASVGRVTANVAENEMLGVRDAVGMRRRLPLEDENRAPRMQAAQMVVGPAVAEAQAPGSALRCPRSSPAWRPGRPAGPPVA